MDQCVQTTEDRKKKANTRQESHPTCSRAGPVPVCTRLLGAFAPFTVRQRDLSRDGSLSQKVTEIQVVELIKARHSNDEKSVQLMRNQFRNNKVELRIPRLPHPLHAVLTQQALASGVQPPPTPAAPHIAPLPEGFALDPPVTSQLHQPASARGQAPKRPAPETPASPVFEGLPSGPLSPAPPQPILYPLVRSPSYCLWWPPTHSSRGPPL